MRFSGTIVSLLLFHTLTSLVNGETIGNFKSDSLEITMPGVDPKVAETYLCTSLKLDDNETGYVVGFSTNASMKVAHHLILFGCSAPGSRDEVWNCGADMTIGNHHDFISNGPCAKRKQHFLYAWARNAPQLHLPEGVAFEIGKDTEVQFLVLQIHYSDISSFVGGFKDTSSVSLQLAKTRQPKTAGVYLLESHGHIPANSKENMESACSLPEELEVHPFAFRTHTHNLGRVVSGYQVHRDPNGIDQWTLLGQKDPMLPQAFYPVSQNVTARKGDYFASRCTMVSNRTRETLIGETDEHEMCRFYIMYWIEGSRPLSKTHCLTAGPPDFYWHTANPPLNNIPKE